VGGEYGEGGGAKKGPTEENQNKKRGWEKGRSYHKTASQGTHSMTNAPNEDKGKERKKCPRYQKRTFGGGGGTIVQKKMTKQLARIEKEV